MKRIFLPLIVLLIFVLACNDSKKEFQIQDLPTISIQHKQFYVPYCIYHLDETDDSVVKEIEKQVAGLLPQYQLVDSLSEVIGKNEYKIEWFADPVNEYPAPDLVYLQHSGHGLSSQEMTQLQSPSSAVLITFSGTNEDVIDDQISINEIISSLLKESDFVTDYITFNTYNNKSWKKYRVANFSKENIDITSQFTIHLYRENEYCRAVTLGMGKFCLPDISIQDFSCNDQETYGSLINLVSQLWIEQPVIREDSTMVVNIDAIKNDSVRIDLLNSLQENASKKALISLSNVEPQEGDAYNFQYEIVFNDKKYSSKQEQQSALVSQIFGSTDEIQYVKHNEKIIEASLKAKAKLPKLKIMFNKGLEPGYSILLKAPFEDDIGGTEWMWIEVTEWQATSIKGILQNDPFEISDLAAGAIVSANTSDIFDYILYFPDGSEEGNETGKIMGGLN